MVVKFRRSYNTESRSSVFVWIEWVCGVFIIVVLQYVWQFITGFALNVFNIIIRTTTTILSADSSVRSYRSSANLQWFMLFCVAGTTVIIVTPTSLMIQ